MNTFIVGLTGGIGSGKSTVSSRFTSLGIDIVDSDLIAREIVAPGSECLKIIQQHFGDQVIQGNGELDRQTLKSLIFTDAENKHWLESLMHPRIRQLTRTRLAQTQSPYAILDSPLLLETSLKAQQEGRENADDLLKRQLIQRILIVDTTPEIQVTRTIKRDNMDEPLARKIIASQIAREQRLSYADDIINNSGSHIETYEQVESLHQSYLQLAQNHR
ncbi:MAG: dephospho-CoA kinase [Alteromonadaceae bacterium]|nr:MAG: dephospho-CoA kinase [Alteromonadaceae bacterium]